jgi:leucyl aminopeptidase
MACERLLIIGLGKAEDMKLATYRKVSFTAAVQLNKIGCQDGVFCLQDIDVPKADMSLRVRHAVEAIGDAVYQFDELKTKSNSKSKLTNLDFFIHRRNQMPALQIGVKHGGAIDMGKNLAKDLANLPGNICTPTYLADRARSLGKSHPLRITVLDEERMEDLGMGALLSVSKGSRQPAKLIIMRYEGGSKSSAPVALVGKGLTFDAGGISLKPAEKMDEMKYDMCGGASVLGTLLAAAEMKLPINVVGVIPSSENLPDGNANKPGDIVESMSGQSIEILNTDAEGRLILCDALTYTQRFKPDAVIDIATLTGACVVALGKHASGLMGNDQDLIEELLEAGENSLDRAWPLPLWDEYQPHLDSNFADIANIGGRYAGAITAACFLSRFTEKFKWAHLDIAGTAWREGDKKGATGRVVPLLTQFLINRCG